MSGERPSVRLPSRIVPIWVSDPIGLDLPRRMDSTPAMKVVATAPIPGVRMPSLPVAGRMSADFPAMLRDFVSDMLETPSIILGHCLQPSFLAALRRWRVANPAQDRGFTAEPVSQLFKT